MNTVEERVARMYNPCPVGATLNSPRATAEFARGYLDGREVECLLAVALDAKLRVIEADILFIGTDGYAVVDPKVILRWALTRKRMPRHLVLAHNHPSGDTTPSDADHEATKRMRKACEVVGLKLADHVIVCDGDSFYSFAADGAL